MFHKSNHTQLGIVPYPNERTNKGTKLSTKYRFYDVAHRMPCGSSVRVTYYMSLTYVYTLYSAVYVCIYSS